MKIEINTETKTILLLQGRIKLSDIDILKEIIIDVGQWDIIMNRINNEVTTNHREEQEYYPNGKPKYWWSKIGRKHLCRYNDDGTERPRLGNQNTRKK